MQIRKSKDKGEWDAFIKAHGPRSGAFLESWVWLDFKESVGDEVRRLGVYDDGGLCGVAGVVVQRMPLGSKYSFCARGPVVKDPARLEEVVRLLQKEAGGLFFRFEPAVEGMEFAVKGAKESKEIHPANTLILDLSPDEDEILKNMHHKTRYNIRLAGRKGVEVDLSGKVSLEDVWEVFKTTASRDKIRLHAKSYYEKMLNELDSPRPEVGEREKGAAALPEGGPASDPRAFIAAASFKNQVLAATIMIDFGNTRTYLHGASSNEHRNLMAPYALHWALIKDAKEKGFKYYDWYGITASRNPLHPWAGITRFKKGFGGEVVSYPGTFDFVQKPVLYNVYQISRSAARITRSILKK